MLLVGENGAEVPTPRQEAGCLRGAPGSALTAAAPDFPALVSEGGTLLFVPLTVEGLKHLPQCRAAQGMDG